jgi:hypothetical protein
VVALKARPEQGEGLVTGDVVNTASRLQGVAPVNAVAVSEATFRATERIIDFEPLEPVTVKGKTEPLPIYRPLRPRARFGSDVMRTHATPLVGRELEKPLLTGTFERAAQQQSCQLVTLVGEPGVGKSRLCAELLGYVEERRGLVRWRQGRCLPYGEGIAFWALGEIVKAEAGILESDSPQAALAKLKAAIPNTAGDPHWLLQRLAPLVGAESGAPAEREELFTAWRRFLEGLAAARPTVLVFEDLQWADDALLAFLEYVAEWSRDVPLLVVCAARPELYERRPNWGAGLRNAQTINLNPLSDHEMGELVSYLSRSIELSEQLERTSFGTSSSGTSRTPRSRGPSAHAGIGLRRHGSSERRGTGSKILRKCLLITICKRSSSSTLRASIAKPLRSPCRRDASLRSRANVH